MNQLHYNPSSDGTFEPETRLQKFQRLIELRQQALFNTEFYLSLNEMELARRYYRLMNWIEDRMRTV